MVALVAGWARAAISISRKPKKRHGGVGNERMPKMTVERKKSVERRASFMALFKSRRRRRRGTDQRLRGDEKEIRFSPPSFFSLFVTFLIRLSARRGAAKFSPLASLSVVGVGGGN